MSSFISSRMRQIKVGYSTGVWDLFHHGHLNILKKAKEKCDFLIVGVSTDELCISYKNKKPVVPFEERVAILESIKFVDMVVPQSNMDKYEAWKKIKFNVIFHGDDIQNNMVWKNIDKLKDAGVEIVLIPYTKGISSTERKEQIQNGS